MSTVALAGDYHATTTSKDLEDIASQWNIKVPEGDTKDAYLLLLQSTEAIFAKFRDLPDYVHPELIPVTTKHERSYRKLPADEDPNNAWSHVTNIQADNPTSSLLEGRSIAIKDNISVGGLPMTLGTFPQFVSKDDAYPISPIDATVVRRVLEAGGIIKGTAMCETYSAAPISCTSATGPIHNPWAHGYTCGGSSSGCGCLLGMNAAKQHGRSQESGVDLAIGGDQGGSIRIPASFNGIFGLKPTHGLVPYTGAASLTPMIDHLGPMANNLRDVALLLEVMAGYDGMDARMTAESPLRQNVKSYSAIVDDAFRSNGSVANNGRLRVGLLTESFQVPGLTEEVRTAVYQAATSQFKAVGAEVIEVSVAMHEQGPLIWTAATRAALGDLGCAGKMPGYLTYTPPQVQLKWPPNQEQFDRLTETNPTIFNLMMSGDLVRQQFGVAMEAKGHRKVFELRKAYDDVLQDVDILVTPTTPTVAMPHPKTVTANGEKASIMEKVKAAVGIVANTCAFNVTGHPALSMPCGLVTRGTEDGGEIKLPVGMQLIAKRWDEETLFRAAAMFEKGLTGAS